jgi:excisionase family DNA binding protein
MASELLLLEEVAALTRVQVSCVRYWIRTGKLASLKPGRRVLVRRTVLEKFLTDAERATSSKSPVSSRGRSR